MQYMQCVVGRQRTLPLPPICLPVVKVALPDNSW